MRGIGASQWTFEYLSCLFYWVPLCFFFSHFTNNMLTSLIRDNANERFISPSPNPRTHSFESPFFSIAFTVPYCQCYTRNIFKRNHTPINCSSNVPTFRNICIFSIVLSTIFDSYVLFVQKCVRIFLLFSFDDW